MDYSLLLVIEQSGYSTHDSRHCLRSSEPGSKEVYHIGIIDYLQSYNFDKKIESKFKGLNPKTDPG